MPYLKIAPILKTNESDLGLEGDLLMSSDTHYIFLFPSGGKPTGAALHGLAPQKVIYLITTKNR